MCAIACASVAVTSPAAARPDTPGTTEIFRYEASDVVDAYDSPGGRFKIHFTRTGLNAVPAADTDVSGVPDHVERVALIYDEVLAFYQDTLGFRAPLDDATLADNGGDARFDVYLLDFGGRADGSFRGEACGIEGRLPGQCAGFMVQENDFAGYPYPSVDYANRVLASHELFHAVQAAYDADQGSVLSEGTAVWATEMFDGALSDLEGFVHGYFEHLDRPIDQPLPGPVDPFSYGSAIFFRFLEERFDPDLIRVLWEACETEEWLPALDAILARDHGSSFAAAFDEFVAWNMFTGARADPARSYVNGASYPLVTVEPVSAPYSTGPLRVFYASSQLWSVAPGSRSRMGASLTGDSEGLTLRLATRQGDSVRVLDESVTDTNGVDELFVLVSYPARMGMSRRPGLCIGTPIEIAECEAAMQPDAGAPDRDAGTNDASMFVDGGPGSAGGCACSLRPSRRAPLAAALGALVIVLGLRRRARFTP
ncbi:MAG: hypothetical protein K8H88_23530 [Sandaracinaceae bacterium]|nr:hypothetical protein [Sandaracinaceae bacterium]